MRTGELDTVISIYTPAETTNASGQVVKSYSLLSSAMFANIQYNTATEQNQADQKVAVETALITIYDRIVTVTSQMLILIGTTYWEIISVQPDKSRYYLQLNCRKRDNQNIGL